MAAPKGNKYNEIWTLETAREFIIKSLDTLKVNDNIMFIGTLAIAMNTYRDFFEYIVKRFEDQDKDFRTKKNQIDTIIEERLFTASLTGKVKEATAIMGLKANYGWKDRFDHTTDDKPLQLPKLEIEVRDYTKSK